MRIDIAQAGKAGCRQLESVQRCVHNHSKDPESRRSDGKGKDKDKDQGQNEGEIESQNQGQTQVEIPGEVAGETQGGVPEAGC